MSRAMYSLEYLMDIMRPHKIKTSDIKPIEFIMKDENQIFSEEEKKRVRESIFISIVSTQPKINILRECCVAIDSKGGVVTHLNNLYMPFQSGIYAYNKTTIEIVSKWNYGFNMIRDINEHLATLEIDDFAEVIKFINDLQLKKYTRKLERKVGTIETISYKGVEFEDDSKSYYVSNNRH